MPKFKPSKAVLKRVRVTGSGKVRFKPSNNSHLRSNKNGTQIRALRKPRIAKAGDVDRIGKMIGRRLIPG